jgi:hypothetical protein
MLEFQQSALAHHSSINYKAITERYLETLNNMNQSNNFKIKNDTTQEDTTHFKSE